MPKIAKIEQKSTRRKESSNRKRKKREERPQINFVAYMPLAHPDIIFQSYVAGGVVPYSIERASDQQEDGSEELQNVKTLESLPYTVNYPGI